MKAMVLHTVGEPLELKEVSTPEPNDRQLLLKVQTCGICRTDLHIVDGELEDPNLPLILGHQIVGTVEQVGSSVTDFEVGDNFAVPAAKISATMPGSPDTISTAALLNTP